MKSLRQLMHNHIIDYIYWRFDESPIKIQVVFGSTGTPTQFHIGDHRFVIIDAQFFCIVTDFGHNFIVRLLIGDSKEKGYVTTDVTLCSFNKELARPERFELPTP